MLQSMREGARSKLIKFLLFSLLILAGLGLVLTDIGGFFRSGPASNVALEVGERTVSLIEFDQLLNQEIRNRNITLEQAIHTGVIPDLINREIALYVIQNEARKLGIHISDERVAQQIHSLIDSLLNPTGENQNHLALDKRTKQAVFDRFLQSIGMTEQGYVATEKARIASYLLVDSLTFSDLTLPMISKNLAAYEQEKRTAESYLVKFPSIQDPNEESLQEYYESRKHFYALPEYRSFSTLAINPQTLQGTISIDEEVLKNEYERRIDQYTTPATRSLSYVVVKEEDQAKRIIQQAKKDRSFKQAIEDVMGNSDLLIDNQTYQKEELPAELADVVFSISTKGVGASPIRNAFGWTVYEINTIQEEKIIPYKSAKQSIREELEVIEISETLYSLLEQIEDLVASGATLHETAKTLNLPLKAWPFSTITGETKDKTSLFNAESPFTNPQQILSTVFSIQENETSHALETEEETYLFIQVNEIEQPRFLPLSEIKETIIKDWKDEQKLEKVKEKSQEIIDQLEKGETPIRFKTHKPIRRDKKDQFELGEIAAIALFQIKEKGDITSIPNKNGALILRLKDISIPAANTLTQKDWDGWAQTQAEIRRDILNQYYEALKDDLTIEYDEQDLITYYKNRLNP